MIFESIDGKILRTDLHGKVVETIVDLTSLTFIDSIIYDSLSPNKKQLAYLIGYGTQEYSGYEFQDLFVVDLNDLSSIYQLTQSDKTTFVAWHPTGKQIAFDGVAQNKFRQVFVVSFDKMGNPQKFQISEYNQTVSIKAMSWSPDGTYLAVSYTEDNLSFTQIYTFENGIEATYPYASFPLISTSLWWQDSSVLGIQGTLIKNNQQQKGVFWIDIQNKEIVHVLSAEIVPDGNIILFPKPISQNKIGFFSGNNEFLIYDMNSKFFTKPVDIFDDLLSDHWYPIPSDFPGELICSKNE